MVHSSASLRFSARCGPVAVLMLALLGCDTDGAPPTSRATARPSTPAVAVPGTAAPSATGSAAASVGHSGSWQGSYTATQAAVTIPKGVKAATWKSDDGSAATGEGKVEITIEATGQVTGKSSGPLGPMTMRGVFEDETLRAGLTPTDPGDEGAMTGILVGRPDGKAILGELRVSSRDAALVRSAKVRLERP